MRPVLSERRAELRFVFDCRRMVETCHFDSKCLPTASGTKFDRRKTHGRTPVQSSDTVVFNALAMRAMLIRLALRTPRSMPLM